MFDIQENIHIYSDIFIDNKKSIEFMDITGFLKIQRNCNNCINMPLKFYKDKNRNNNCFFKCAHCKKKSSYLCGTIFQNTKINMNILLRLIYAFVGNFDMSQMQLITGLSKNTIIDLRKKIINIIKSKSDIIFSKIGGPGIRVQIDETAICRGKIITNPSNTLDGERNNEIQWLIGGIEETDEKRIFLMIIPNREITTFYNVLLKHVNIGSIVITDGHPSYPSAVSQFNSHHIIVPHCEGFTNINGDNTNLIENLWSHLKVEYKIRRGIAVNRMEDFIYEFYYKKSFIKERTQVGISNSFLKLLSFIFN
ncbi:hypothetical protein DMUE_6001 [Dictyocoela muelleri]|nr:hypothetical protein DMUE_6001 [Dictyocoela muelleri]